MRKTAIAFLAAAALTLAAVPATASAACPPLDPATCPVAPPSGATECPKLPPPNVAALTEAISELPDKDTTGALVRVTGSAGDWSGTAGYSDITTHAPVDPDSYVRIGSTTKAFTAVVVLQLAQEHRLDLDQPVQRYLPGVLPASYPPIPVRTLLDHTSGLPSVDLPWLADPDQVIEHRYEHWSPAQVLATATAHPMDYPPGTAQKYTNTSYVLAGLLIEKVTGDSYGHAVRDRIARPLGMSRTYEPGDDTHLPNPHSNGYITKTNGVLADVTEMNQSIPWSAGSLVSTAADLDRFITGLFRGRLLGPAMMKRLFTIPEVSMFGGSGKAYYSQGLMRIEVGGVTVWGKTGSRYGYSSGVFATRDLQRKLAYSVNATTKSSEGQPVIVQRIAAAAAAAPKNPPVG
ncbi:serine hydrolase domain-containing protein [Amycolatopsis sp. H20-H5]|uniref:serine hydrolase domain-containing protein n=1 Tax=Amycolatopsis sp. H20-H5 TaxID=3046309 RepID=UPI002DBE66BD|nr:serine hydrolase domain-containing protein [Amycolatopsis sp. H20-H5]MEC3980099.1 serine hydrolase domain-containing protein [Amycolatopsis sp. H20-H5]